MLKYQLFYEKNSCYELQYGTAQNGLTFEIVFYLFFSIIRLSQFFNGKKGCILTGLSDFLSFSSSYKQQNHHKNRNISVCTSTTAACSVENRRDDFYFENRLFFHSCLSYYHHNQPESTFVILDVNWILKKMFFLCPSVKKTTTRQRIISVKLNACWPTRRLYFDSSRRS